jgi:ribosome-associated protein
MTDNKQIFKNLAISAARLADAKKAEAVSVFDMAGRSELADYVVVVTVDNPAQMDAVDDEISINLKKEGFFAIYRDGMKSKNWKVLDYGGIIVHIFEKQAREFYSFDKVFAGYSAIKWEEKAAAKEVTGRKLRAELQAADERKTPAAKALAAPGKAKAVPMKAKAASKKNKTAAKKAKKPPVKKAKKTVKKVPARKAAPKKKAAKKIAKKKK